MHQVSGEAGDGRQDIFTGYVRQLRHVQRLHLRSYDLAKRLRFGIACIIPPAWEHIDTKNPLVRMGLNVRLKSLGIFLCPRLIAPFSIL